MYCRKCGARMSEQDRFCPECGTEASKGNTQQDELNGFPGNEQPQENPRMNKKTVIWIWILAAWILLIATGISAFFIVKGQHVKKQYQSSLEAGDKYLENLDYEKVGSLRIEARQKLEAYRPVSIGQASRISGVSPADISVLLVYMEQYGRRKQDEV